MSSLLTTSNSFGFEVGRGSTSSDIKFKGARFKVQGMRLAHGRSLCQDYCVVQLAGVLGLYTLGLR